MDLNDQLEKVWEKHCSKKTALVPQYFRNPEDCHVLFIGLNPSFVAPHLTRWMNSECSIENAEPTKFFKWHTRKKFVREHCYSEQSFSYKNHPYFGFHRKLFSDSELNWCHTDLYRIRKSAQNDTLDSLNDEFKRESHELFLAHVAGFKPKVIVVLNAAVFRILKTIDYNVQSTVRFDDHFNDIAGHWWTNVGTEKVPTIYSGHIGRSLATPNRQLLEWHIRKILTGIDT